MDNATMATKKINVAAETVETPWNRTAFQIAMEKTTPIVAPVDDGPSLEALEMAGAEIMFQIQQKKMKLGMIPTRLLDGTIVERPIIETQPFFKPERSERTRFYRDSDLIIDLSKPKAKTTTAKAYTAPADDFDPLPTKKAEIKAESTPRDQKKAGIDAYKTLFQKKMHALTQLAKKTPGQWIKGSVINPEAPELAMKFNVRLAACYNGGGEFELMRGGKNQYHIVLSTDGSIDPSEIPVKVKQQ